MPSFAVLGHRLRPSVQERAFADTLTLPVLLPAIGPEAQVMPEGWVVVVQPLRPPRVSAFPRARRLRPVLAGAIGFMLCALPAVELHGDESAGAVVMRVEPPPRAQPVGMSAQAPPDRPPAVESDSGPDARPASRPDAPVGRPVPAAPTARNTAPARPGRATSESIGWFEHEWRVAEAMRQRYHELYARRLVDWESWQAREAEALRARLRWEAMLAGRSPA